VRGENNVGIENDCVWAVPKNTWEGKFNVKSVTIEAERTHDYKNLEYVPNKNRIIDFVPCA